MTAEDQEMENSCCRLWKEGSVVHCIIKAKKIDLEIARNMVALRHTFFAGKAYPTIVDIRAVKSVTKEARDLFASTEGTVNIIAAALISPSVLTKMLATFFMAFNRPPVPVKIFQDSAEARSWLDEFKA